MGDLPSLVPLALLKYISAYLLHHNLHTFPHSQTTSGFRINLNSQYGIIRKNYCYWNNWKDVEQLHFRISTKVGPRLENMTGGVVRFYYVSMLNLANERAGRSERRCGEEKYLSVSCIWESLRIAVTVVLEVNETQSP